MIDTHAHINTDKFDEDREQVIKRALESGVERIIIPAIEPKDFDNLLALVHSNSELSCGIGVHPHNVAELTQKELDLVNEKADSKDVVAIGEIGIDYYYDFAPKDKQKEMFDKQIKIALDKNLPIIVHNREADDDVLDIINQNQNGNLKGVLHCFSSPLDTLKRTLDIGMNVSFTGNITFKKSTLDDVVKYVPNDRFMIETDSPYITPVPNRGKRNEPSYVRYVAEKIAEIKEISIEEVIQMSTKTAKELFKLSAFIILFLSTLSFNSYSQDEGEFYDDEEYYDDEYLEEDEGPYYNKTFGIGGLAGVNTIVEVRIPEGVDQDRDERSYEGLPAFGGELAYYPFPYMFLKIGYMRSLNNKTREDLIRRGAELIPDPDVNQLYEFSINATPNPDAIINFYGILGVSLINNTYQIQEELDAPYQSNNISNLAVNYGIGLMSNIELGNYGVLALSAEVKFNYEIGTTNTRVWVGIDPNDQNIFDQLDIYNIFSIPRVSIIYFPNF